MTGGDEVGLSSDGVVVGLAVGDGRVIGGDEVGLSSDGFVVGLAVGGKDGRVTG